MSSNLILEKLSSLRRQLTLWIFVHGLGRWLLILLGILGLDMALDRLFKMDFAQRLVLLVLIAAAVAAFFIWRVVRPLLFRASDTALIYEVEQRHPQLQEALISSFQLAKEDPVAQTGVSRQLAQATIATGNQRASAVDFGAAIDSASSGWNWLILAIGLMGVTALGFGVTSNTFLKTWFNRNILLGDDQWPQQTYLEIAGVVDGTLVVPRGSDYRQLVIVSEKSAVKDVSVSLEIDNPGGRSFVPMKPTGKSAGREHLFTFHNVSSEFKFRASGGDDTTDWINVRLVEPPNVSEMNLTVKLPEYTRQPDEALTAGGPYSILRGSSLNVDIKTNKPLAKAEIGFGDTSFAMQQTDNEQSFSTTLPQSGELMGGEYQLDLKDLEGVPSNRKSKFKISIKEDKPPRVLASLLGISGEVVPRAMIPTSYQAKDEYGIENLAFECTWKTSDEENASIKNEMILIARDGQEGPLKESTNHVKTVSVLELSQLKLEPGISLKLRVAAKDFYPEQDNTGYSQEFLLRVVTEAQLRASLLRREIEQREAFQQAYEKQLALATELQAIRVRQKPDEMTQQAFLAEQETKMIEMTRQQKAIGTAIDSIANRFEDFLVEVKNNRLDEAENKIAPEQRIETRFDQKIIQPIRKLDRELVALASRQMEACRVNVREPDALNQAAELADGIHQQILLEMKAILSAMSDSENFQGIINDILEIKKDNLENIRRIEKQKPKDGDIFNDDDIFNK